MRNNPFKFGTVVEGDFFTNRTDEIKKVRSVLSGENHLIMISPRRFGKTSLVFNVINSWKRPVIALDLQLITSPADLAAELLKRIYRAYPAEKIRGYIKSFRIIPTINLNPVTNAVDVSFQPASDTKPILEDVLNLSEKLSSPGKKLIVVLDEFQTIYNIDKNMPQQLRSVMQHHKNINYVFMGSQESLIREIFEHKKSPFYHFGVLMPLDKIPEKEFHEFLTERFSKLLKDPGLIASGVLEITDAHPYYTQRLAFTVWEIIKQDSKLKDPVGEAARELIQIHDIDYERLWNTLNKTDKKILIGLASMAPAQLNESFFKRFFIDASSTAYSSIKRLMDKGFIIVSSKGYDLDDPFFKKWIVLRRSKGIGSFK